MVVLNEHDYKQSVNCFIDPIIGIIGIPVYGKELELP